MPPLNFYGSQHPVYTIQTREKPKKINNKYCAVATLIIAPTHKTEEVVDNFKSNEDAEIDSILSIKFSDLSIPNRLVNQEKLKKAKDVYPDAKIQLG
jgi:hypothetical protein